MKKPILFLLLTLLFSSCEKSTIDYEKVEYQVRKKTMSSWYGFVEPKITIKEENIYPLYKLYEKKISEYQKDLLRNLKHLDTLNNHKELWMASITTKNLAKTPEEQLEHSYFFATPEDEYKSILESSYFAQRILTQELDSIEALYNEVSKETKYYEIVYNLQEASTIKNSNGFEVDLKIWIDRNSKVFEYLFLDMPIKEKTKK